MATATKKPKQKKNLVIVESPAKAKTLKKFLGTNYKIEASMGHVRDLPKSDLGVDLENDFEPRYITIRGKGDLLKKLRRDAKSADKVYLATDPDREGEAISWHLYSALNLEGKETYRITFNEITKQAVKNSIKEAREINMTLVDAQQARRVLDRVVGYQISPILWKKVKKGLSAGRVQSTALKIICDREEEIANFVPEEYWTMDFKLAKGSKSFDAHLLKFKSETPKLNCEADVEVIKKNIKKAEYTVEKVKEGSRTRKPQAPFKTSTLQQETSRVLGFLTSKTMKVAQELYEGVEIKGQGTIGLISYIRTDSVRISDEAYEECKEYISTNYGEEYLPESRNIYKTKSNAQDAHEAIRPTYVSLAPNDIKESLTKDQFKLYKLIWEKFVASQMREAKYRTLAVDIMANDALLRTNGSLLEFDGFLQVIKSEENLDKDVKIPELKEGDNVKFEELLDVQHFTQPPARFTDASLVKILEDSGIGRPSTYAPTISTITNRGYILRDSKILYPTELGEIVNEIMESNFANIVDTEFTAELERGLDRIEDGEIEWKDIIRNFYPEFAATLKEAEEKVAQIEIKDEVSDQICEKCGRNLVIKTGRYGKFLACPGFPECSNAKPLLEESGENCPICGGRVLVKKTKKGRKYFGCEHTPECDFMSWYKPVDKKCPKCGTYMVEKGTKEKKLSCTNETCQHTEVVQEEVQE